LSLIHINQISQFVLPNIFYYFWFMTLYEFKMLNDDDQLTFYKSLRETSYHQYGTYISKLPKGV